jgi:hypothetical protein
MVRSWPHHTDADETICPGRAVSSCATGVESTERRDATMLIVELLDQPTMPVLAIMKIG